MFKTPNTWLLFLLSTIICLLGLLTYIPFPAFFTCLCKSWLPFGILCLLPEEITVTFLPVLMNFFFFVCLRNSLHHLHFKKCFWRIWNFRMIVFPFSTPNMLLRYLVVWTILGRQSAIILTFIPLYMSFFFLYCLVLKIFSLSLVLDNLIMMYLGCSFLHVSRPWSSLSLWISWFIVLLEF